ncbi:MAG: hypothetical protein IPL35_15020 [Sphingobacteriales bacterium]|nr:hypothetical protein [Sphingobacteriales bacterium]
METLGAHLVTASYITAEAAALDEAFRAAGLLFMGELGLDPAIDQFAIMELLHRLRGQGAQLHAVSRYTRHSSRPKAIPTSKHYKLLGAPMNGTRRTGAYRAICTRGDQITCYRRLFENYWVHPIAGIGDVKFMPFAIL